MEYGVETAFWVKTATSAKPMSELGLSLFAEGWYMGVYTGDISCWVQYLFISFYLRLVWMDYLLPRC
jgi:hypothetical protein